MNGHDAADREIVAMDDMTGLVFTRLRVLGRAESPVPGHATWACLCDPDFGGCGATKSVTGSSLRRGGTKSCGCMRMEIMSANRPAKLANRAERNSWTGMLNRCFLPACTQFKWYGGRGITVCDRWRYDFAAFLEDMGPKPTAKHSIDRINNDGNYEPGNCRWATQVQQARNKTTSRLLTCFGETKCITEWANDTGIGLGCLWSRLGRGMDIESALTLPTDKGRTAMRFDHDGRSLTINEWATVIGLSADLIRNRLASGWSVEKTLTQPVDQRLSRPKVIARGIAAPEKSPREGSPREGNTTPAVRAPAAAPESAPGDEHPPRRVRRRGA